MANGAPVGCEYQPLTAGSWLPEQLKRPDTTQSLYVSSARMQVCEPPAWLAHSVGGAVVRPAHVSHGVHCRERLCRENAQWSLSFLTHGDLEQTYCQHKALRLSPSPGRARSPAALLCGRVAAGDGGELRTLRPPADRQKVNGMMAEAGPETVDRRHRAASGNRDGKSCNKAGKNSSTIRCLRRTGCGRAAPWTFGTGSIVRVVTG